MSTGKSLEAASGHFMRIRAITAATANPVMNTIPTMSSVPAAMMVCARYSTVTLFARLRG